MGSKWALGRAKHNLVSNYLLVGLTEELGDFIAVLEAALPKMFAGATQLYTSGERTSSSSLTAIAGGLWHRGSFTRVESLLVPISLMTQVRLPFMAAEEQLLRSCVILSCLKLRCKTI